MSLKQLIAQNWRRKLAYRIHIDQRVIKYLKKIKDRQLKEKFVDIIYDKIAQDPWCGDQKTGNLKVFFTKDFRHNKTSYRIAYTIGPEREIVVVVLAGSRENFYQELKRVIN